jgi:protein required for attachment to host cells
MSQGVHSIMKKNITWILVADGKRARILHNDGPGLGLTAVPGGEHSIELKPSREMTSDKPGRTQESATSSRHAIEPRVDWHRFEKTKFAQSMAKILDEAGARGSFDRLVLVAPPRTLGDLRAALADTTRARVSAEIDKDLTHEPLNALARRLGETLTL